MSNFITLTNRRRWREPAEISLCSAGPHHTARRTQTPQFLTMNASRWPNAFSGAPPIWLGSIGAKFWPSRPSSSTRWWRLALHATLSSNRGPRRWPRSLWLKEDHTTKNSSGALSSTLTKPSNNFNLLIPVYKYYTQSESSISAHRARHEPRTEPIHPLINSLAQSPSKRNIKWTRNEAQAHKVAEVRQAPYTTCHELSIP